MSATQLYTKIRQMLNDYVNDRVDSSSRDRIALLVLGIIKGKSASPARIAQALDILGLSDAKVESIERRIRRIENDPEISASLCFHPFARQCLACADTSRLVLIIDPTTQDDRVVMLTASVSYRGRSLPIAWAVWPANCPLEGERFWERVKALLEVVAGLLPEHVQIIWLADRAFGTPAFIDLLAGYGWDYVVRVQKQTVCRDRMGG